MKVTFAIVVSTTVLAVFSTLARAQCPDSPTTLLVPAYFYPLPNSPWQQLEQAAMGGARVVAILNPNSGPGTEVDPGYVAAIASARAAGVKLIAYVPTNYAGRSSAAVIADVQQYINFYGLSNIDGVFWDEMSDDISTLSYYQTITAGARALIPNAFVVANPGTNIPETLAVPSVADTFVLYENNTQCAVPFSTYEPPAWALNGSSSRVAYIVYNSPALSLSNTLNLAQQRNAGYVFVTDDVLDNPYDTLPAYWTNEWLKSKALCCDSVDFNNDSSIFDPMDIDAFLSVYSEGPCIPASATCNSIDFNNDTSIFDPRDIDSFLSVYSEGPCF